MKAIRILSILAAAGFAASTQAEEPRPGADRPQGGPPSSRPDADRRDGDRDGHHRDRHHGHDRGPGAKDQQRRPDDGGDKVSHIREALKHLRAAGLGDMAERLEHAIGQRVAQHHGHDHGRRDGGRPHMDGRREGPQQFGAARPPQRPPLPWSPGFFGGRPPGPVGPGARPQEHDRRGPDKARSGGPGVFARPQPFASPGGDRDGSFHRPQPTDRREGDRGRDASAGPKRDDHRGPGPDSRPAARPQDPDRRGPGPDSARRPDADRPPGSNEQELRGQVQGLQRELESLRKQLKERQEGPPRDGRREEPRKEEHRKDEPRKDEPKKDELRRDDAGRGEPRKDGPGPDAPRQDRF